MSAEPMSITAEAPRGSEQVDQYLTFALGSEQYGTDVMRVQEIKVWEGVTRVPYSPKYILGVINLRGAIVPVIDLRVRFGLKCALFDSKTVIVVVRVAGERGERVAGIVVDSVKEVHDIAASDIQPPPELLGSVDQVFVKALASVDGKLVILLDMEKLVTSSIMGEGASRAVLAA
jgi:purine-binding chemotaxis protein CheW